MPSSKLCCLKTSGRTKENIKSRKKKTHLPLRNQRISVVRCDSAAYFRSSSQSHSFYKFFFSRRLVSALWLPLQAWFTVYAFLIDRRRRRLREQLHVTPHIDGEEYNTQHGAPVGECLGCVLKQLKIVPLLPLAL